MILFTFLVLAASALLFAIIERPKVCCALFIFANIDTRSTMHYYSLWHARVKVNRVLAVHSRYQLFLNGGLRALSLYLIFCSLRCVHRVVGVCGCVWMHVCVCARVHLSLSVMLYVRVYV